VVACRAHFHAGPRNPLPWEVWKYARTQKPIFADYMNRHIESRHRATVLSAISMISGAYIALMGLVVGGIADFSLTGSFVLMGSMVLISALLVRVEERHVTVTL